MESIEANGYNVQVSIDVESGFIVSGYETTDRVDNEHLIPNVEKVEEILGKSEERGYLFDGGYLNSTNLRYGEESGRKIIIKDPYLTGRIPSEKTAKRLKVFNLQHFEYDKEEDCFRCINGEKLENEGKQKYKCKNCKGCSYIDKCMTGKKKENKVLVATEFFSQRMKALEKEEYKENIGERLKIEKVFGNLKWNHGMRRFRRKGLSKVGTEVSLWILILNVSKFMKLLSDKNTNFINILLQKVQLLLILLIINELNAKKYNNNFQTYNLTKF